MTTHLVLSQSDGRPMYLQIMEQIKNKIAVGDWQPGYKLPSIRELAVALKVSVITVKRAYHELENEQVIMTQQGRGSFVNGNENMGLKMKQKELDQQLEAALKTAAILGMSVKEISKRLTELKENQSAGSKGEDHE